MVFGMSELSKINPWESSGSFPCFWRKIPGRFWEKITPNLGRGVPGSPSWSFCGFLGFLLEMPDIYHFPGMFLKPQDPTGFQGFFFQLIQWLIQNLSKRWSKSLLKLLIWIVFQSCTSLMAIVYSLIMFVSPILFLLATLSAQLVCRIEQLFDCDTWDINASFSDVGWDKDDHCIISKILENTTLIKHCTPPTQPSKSCKCTNGKWKIFPNIAMFERENSHIPRSISLPVTCWPTSPMPCTPPGRRSLRRTCGSRNVGTWRNRTTGGTPFSNQGPKGVQNLLRSKGLNHQISGATNQCHV